MSDLHRWLEPAVRQPHKAAGEQARVYACATRTMHHALLLVGTSVLTAPSFPGAEGQGAGFLTLRSRVACCGSRGSWRSPNVGETAVQAFSIHALLHGSVSGLGAWESECGSRMGHRRPKRCAHTDSWASHRFCPDFDVGASSPGCSTDHTLGHFVNIFSTIT